MQTGLYTGTLLHRRHVPKRHEFTYPLFMVMLDVDRIPEMMQVSRWSSYNRWNWASYWERDHLGDDGAPLRNRVEANAAEQGIRLSGGAIFLLTHLRYLGYCFNPISLFYCLDQAGRLEAILAEVTNTFGERWNYWLTEAQKDSAGEHSYRTAKRMHVSPFLPMEMSYRFVLPPPGEQLLAHMDTLCGEQRMLVATLRLQRAPWSAGGLRRALARFPWMTAKVTGAIHWEALRLWWKGAPVFTHPARRKEERHEHVADSLR